MDAVERDTKSFSKVVQHLVDISLSDGWTPIKTVHGVDCSYKKTEDSPYVLVKGEGTIDARIEKILEFLSVPDNMYILDPMLTDVRIVEKVDSASHVFQFKAKMPPMVTNRDFVFQSWDGMWKTDSPRIAVSVGESIVHPDAPEESGYVRGNILVSGYVATEIPDRPSQCKIVYLLQADPKGWLPVWVVNLLAGDQAMNVVRLIQYFEEHPSQEEDEQKSIAVSQEPSEMEETTNSDSVPQAKSKKRNIQYEKVQKSQKIR